MAVNVKLGVDLSSFNSGIKQGQNVLKGLNAEMKATEAEFKATGNAEQMLANKTKTLNSQLQVQKGIADQAKKALKAMDEAGVKPTDAAYQKLYATLMNATAGMNEAQAALNSLDATQQQTAQSANGLADSVNSIGKKISLDQVINGISSIKSGLESAARKAVELGESIWNAVMDKAKWADDTATMAQMYGIDVDTFQRMQKLVTNGLDTTVESMLTAQSKLNKGIGNETKATIDALDDLKVKYKELAGDEGVGAYVSRDPAEVFWEAGKALMSMSDAYDKEAAAQALFGKSWKELVPLFDAENGGFASLEEYNEALKNVEVVSKEDVNALEELNNKVGELKGNFDTLATDVMAQLAPALTDAANALNGVLVSILEYLKTDAGKEMLAKLGDAVSGLFGDLSKIDPEKVVSGFVEVFTKVTDGIQWLVDNADTAKGILATIVAGWGMLTIGENVLKVMKLVDGIKGLTASGAAEGAAAGASWGTAFANAVAAAAPWLIGLYTLLNPAGTAGVNIDQMYANGQVTEAGWQYWHNNLDQWNARVGNVGNAFGGLSSILGNEAAMNIIGDLQLTDEQVIEKLTNELGLVPVPAEVELPENQAQLISDQVGTVEIDGVVHLVDENGNSIGVTGNWWGGDGTVVKKIRKPKANGIWSVPYDGYLAQLHRGERVVPAREVASRNFSSNLYVENMNMSGGLSADALASAIASRNSRIMAGYGS